LCNYTVFKKEKRTIPASAAPQTFFTKDSAQIEENQMQSYRMGTLFDPLPVCLQRFIDQKVGAGESVLWTQQQIERGFTGWFTDITALY
jgi:hypothetical protein